MEYQSGSSPHYVIIITTTQYRITTHNNIINITTMGSSITIITYHNIVNGVRSSIIDIIIIISQCNTIIIINIISISISSSAVNYRRQYHQHWPHIIIINTNILLVVYYEWGYHTLSVII